MIDPLSLLPSVITAIAPHADAKAWTDALTAPMRSSDITRPRRIAMFLGQVAEESGDFRALSEDLYYTTAARIREVWPSRFADQAESAPYIGRPAALANHVYANRMGNGDEESGDGWRYRGRGLIQITGRVLYQMFAKVEARATDPDWLLTPAGAADSACWYWALPSPGRPSLNALADAWNIKAVTERINGGTVNLGTRGTICTLALGAFGADCKTAGKYADPMQTPSAPVESEADRLDDQFNGAAV